MSFSQKRRDTFSKIEPWLYLSPFLIFIIIFTLYPVINVFTISFKDEKQFVELMEKSITIFPSYNIKDYLKLLRGASDHPWARFWTVYNRNSEMNLYPEQKLFTKVMNHIETEFNKTLNEE